MYMYIYVYVHGMLMYMYLYVYQLLYISVGFHRSICMYVMTVDVFRNKYTYNNSLQFLLY